MNITNRASITSKSPKRMLTHQRAVSAQGGTIELTDLKKYTDWQMGLRGDIYGYAPGWWKDALCAAVQDGPATSIVDINEQKAAKKLAELCPDIEAVRFMLNGSDPCGAAVKLARAITGRDKILTYGYHGTASAYAAPPTEFDSDDNRLGTLEAERENYHSLEWLEELSMPFSCFAAVIIECPPVDSGRYVASQWLNELANHAHNQGTLFILDEVVTGFRYAPGGAAEYYDLQGKVDLYCFGKTLGNGYPVSALAGKESIMQWLAEKPGGGGKVHWSNTFNGEPLGMAAALATMSRLQTDSPWEHLYSTGEYLKEQWNALELPWQMAGHPTRLVLQGPDEGLDDLRRHCFENGHILVKHPLYVTMATTRRDVDDLVKVVKKWEQ